ncbi:MAG: DUF2293 domain-containing protein [Oligosphaeraceae bacterium]
MNAAWQNPVQLLPGTPIPRQGDSPERFLKEGHFVALPPGWRFVPSGDPALTRRLKAACPQAWTVVKRLGKRECAVGLCAPAALEESLRTQLNQERESPEYQRKREGQRRSRQRQQREYQGEFLEAVRNFLSFAPRWKELEKKLALAVTAQSTPVGSGTVARTRRIPLEERAKAAVIAWMRHQTTEYDRTWIPQVAGKRREVRRSLARLSLQLLQNYRRGLEMPPSCPLQQALLPRKPDAPAPTPAPAPPEDSFWL